MDLKTLLKTLLRRKWLLTIAVALTFGSAYLGSSWLPDFYEATARFALSDAAPASSVLAGVGIRDAGAMRSRTETELPNRVALAGVRPIIEKTIWNLQIRDSSGDLYTSKRFVELARLSGRSSIRIEQVVNTQMIRVRARARDPDEAAQIANTIARLYMDDDRLSRQAEYRHAAAFVDSQIETVRADYMETLAKIRDFLVAEGMTRLDLDVPSAHARLVELNRERDATQVSLQDARARLDALRGQLAAAPAGSAPAAAIAENRHLERLQDLLTQREAELAAILTEKLPDHPDAQSASQVAASLRAKLQSEIGRLPSASARVHDLEQEMAAWEARRTRIDADIARDLERASRIPEYAFVDAQLQLQHNAARDLYSSLMQTRSQIGIAEAMTLSNLKLVEPAVPPAFSEPAGPKRGQMRAMGLFMGIMLGLGLAFLAEQMDDRIRTPEEAAEVSGIPVLGTVPRFKTRKTSLILHRRPTDPVSEAYRTIMSQILHARPDKVVRSLLVTSPLASEGKSTTVANLGIAAARMGKRVLLVDADLRRPTLHKLFGIDNANGIGTIGSKPDEVDAVVRECEAAGLWILPSGPLPANPGQVIASQTFEEILRHVCECFDLVLVDSPPVLAVHDAMLLAGMVEGSVSVLESGKETRRALVLEKQRFEHSARRPPLGIVINKFSPSRFDDSSYGYYGYYR